MKTGEAVGLKILRSEILQSAPNDHKANSRNQTGQVPYICSSKEPGSIFIRFALQSAVVQIFPTLDFPIDAHAC